MKEEAKGSHTSRKMQWGNGSGKFFYSPKGHHSMHLEDGTYIEVHPDVYNQRFNAYLERLGKRPTSWYEIMQRAEDEWEAYCRLMDAFAEDAQQWLNVQERGVFVEHKSEERSADEKE